MNKKLTIDGTIIGTKQLIKAYTDEGSKILGWETINETSTFDAFKPKGTKRAVVIYFD